jgi:hypothetical protein
MSVKDAYRVASSLRRDTTLRKRVEAYTEAAIAKSKWNAVWVGLLIWLPILAIEAVNAALGLAVGLVTGVVRAPVMGLWASSHELAPKSAATRFFAGWSGATYAMNKTATFNALEAKFVASANSDKFSDRAVGAIAIRLIQAGWLLAALIWTPISLVAGLVGGLRESGKPYDEKRHDPSQFRFGEDTLSHNLPEVAKPAVKAVLPSKLLAVGIGLLPLYFLGAPLWSVGVVGMALVAAAAGIALMPVTPTSSRYPAILRNAPASILSVTGLLTGLGALYLKLTIGLPTGLIIPMAALAFLSGIGLRNLIATLRDKETKAYKLDEPWYIGGFVAAIAVAAAFGLAVVHPFGWVTNALGAAAALGSFVLLYHLPKSWWKGVGTAAIGVPSTIKDVYDVQSFWHDGDVKFGKNVGKYFSTWLGRSYWHGTWLWLPGAIAGAFYLADLAVSLGVGLAVGAARLPWRFFWGNAYARNRDGKAARFWSGFSRWLINSAGEGSKKKTFDPLVRWLAPALNSATETRPTIKAFAAVTALRVIQAVWLAGLLVSAALALTPIFWIPAIVAGVRNASGPKVKDPNAADPDQPETIRFFNWW